MQLTYIENNQRQISICMLNWNCTFVHCTFITDITHLGSLYAFILKSLYPDFSHYFGVLELSSILNSCSRHSSHLTRSGYYHSNRLKSKRITISIRCLTSQFRHSSIVASTTAIYCLLVSQGSPILVLPSTYICQAQHLPSSFPHISIDVIDVLLLSAVSRSR